MLILSLFAWRILARCLTGAYQQKTCSKGVTQCGTHQLQWVENLCSITCFGILHTKCLPKTTLYCGSSIARRNCPQSNWRNPKPFNLFYLFFLNALKWRSNANNNTSTVHVCAPFAFFCHCAELIQQNFLKANQQNCNISRSKKMNSALCLFIFEWRNMKFLLTVLF